MALSLVDADILLLLVITLNAVVLSRNNSQDDLMHNDQAGTDFQKGCPNWQGVLVADGEHYVPNGNDMCMQCTCDKGFPIMCHSVACSPPSPCSSPQQVKERCCEYICLDDKTPRDRNATDNAGDKDDGENITNLSLRLIASTVTSFLVLALLLFMVHRLRQRRLLLAMRRFENQSRQGHTDDTDSDPYIPSTFMSLECPPYTDPPPPYSPPKPPQILPGEQPPPYDEINHNINERNADENRNQIHGVTSSSGSAHSGAGHRRASPRNLARVEHEGHQQRSFELEHHRQGGDNLRAPNTLPAYASTDVVEGLGVVISPGSDVVCYSAGWSSWLGARTGADRRAAEAAGQQRSQHTSSSSSSPGPRVQTLPTTTAFQRFSNIFRRDSWKVKHQGRSDYSTPPYYATIPRNEQSPQVSSSRAKNVSRPYSNGFPDTLYLSYDAGQATYTLGAISPSTTSSSSSEQYDQTCPITTTAGSTTTSSTTSASSSVSPPHSSCLMVSDSLISHAHRQQFHNDLCRHLPPIQLAYVGEVSSSDRGECSRTFPANPTSTEGISPNVAASQSCRHTFPANPTSTEGISPNVAASQSCRSASIDISLQAFMDSIHPRTTNFGQLPSTSTAPPSHTPHHQQSLASFIRSNHSASVADSPGREAVSLDTLCVSNCSIREPTLLLNTIPTQSCSNYFPSLPNGVPGAIQGFKSIREPAQASRDSQELAGTRRIRTCEAGRASNVLELVQGFELPCRPGTPFCGSLSPITGAMVCPTASTSLACPTASTSLACPTASTSPNSIPAVSPSPSPPMVTAANIGSLRRSQSGASQNSVFSVCSETGEKKLKAGESCYSEHTTLSKSRPPHFQEIENVPVVMSCLLNGPGASMSAALHKNHIVCSDACDGRCQSGAGCQSLYTETTLPTEGSATASGGLVPAFAPCGSSNSSHPDNLCTSFAMSPGSDQTYSTNAYQDEDLWRSSIYNFNSLAEIEKSVPVKDVPSLCDTDQMAHSVNIPPLPPFVSCLSSKILKHCLPINDDPGSLLKLGKTHDGLKKLKKKRTKDRTISSPQFCNIAKQVTPSPKHHCSKTSDGNKETPTIQKCENAVKDKEAAVKALRPAEKKHRTHTVANKQHVRLCDPLNCNKFMTRSAGDAPSLYGNADVYRSIGGDVHPTTVTYQTFGPWNQQGVPGSCELSFPVVTPINDLNQPPSYLKSQTENSSPSHAVDGALPGKGDQRKKSVHKRQSTSGERVGHTPSPSRYKSRPKSLATPDTHLNEKRVEATSARASVVQADFGLAGKGARSGFGHDLNFDDQTGIADLHIHESDFGNRRLSIGQDNHPQFNLGPTRKLSRAEGTCDPSNLPSKAAASYGYHPGSRSGLSNELSFTSRPNHLVGKKRQSLPSGVGGAALLVPQDRAGVCTTMTARSRQSDGDNHVQTVQARAGLPDRKVNKTASLEDCIEATSYV